MSNNGVPPIKSVEELKKLFGNQNQPEPRFFMPMEPGEFGNTAKPEPYVRKDQEVKALAERVAALERLIKVTFNGHVLINGQFVKIIP